MRNTAQKQVAKMKWASRAAALAVLTLSGLCRAGPLEDMLAIDWKGYFPNTFTTKRLVPRLGGTAIQLAVASQVPKVVKKALNTEEGKRLGDVTNRLVSSVGDKLNAVNPLKPNFEPVDIQCNLEFVDMATRKVRKVGPIALTKVNTVHDAEAAVAKACAAEDIVFKPGHSKVFIVRGKDLDGRRALRPVNDYLMSPDYTPRRSMVQLRKRGFKNGSSMLLRAAQPIALGGMTNSKAWFDQKEAERMSLTKREREELNERYRAQNKQRMQDISKQADMEEMMAD